MACLNADTSGKTHLQPCRPDEHFTYESLHAGTDTIRLVQVLAGDEESTLNCLLKHVSLAQCGTSSAPGPMEPTRYNAVSYEWGSDDTDKVEIFLNHRPFLVRRNLFNFLQRIRSATSPHASHWLWIDAISLDQNDTTEISSQIPWMSRIFQTAVGVHIWLGLEDATYESALSTVRRFCWSSRLPHSQDAKTVAFEAYHYLSTLSFWERLWIVQEVILARSGTIHYGNESVQWEVFRAGLKHVKGEIFPSPSQDKHPAESNDGSELWNSKMRLLCEYPRPKVEDDPSIRYPPGSLRNLLEYFSRSKSRYVHDRIYALLGLVEGGERFVVDYNETLESLAQRAVVLSAGLRNLNGQRGKDEFFLIQLRIYLGIPTDIPDWIKAERAKPVALETRAGPRGIELNVREVQ